MRRVLNMLALTGLVLGVVSCGGGKTHPTDSRKFGERVLYDFSGGNDGAGPFGVTFDSKGNLIGTSGFIFSSSPIEIVFELSPPAHVPDAWTETTLAAIFGADNGISSLAISRGGNIYGTSDSGGPGPCIIPPPPGCGFVYELSPPAAGSASWTQTVLYGFNGGYGGAFPRGPVIFDSAGNLYGTTDTGVVFKLSPPANGSGPWNESVLSIFDTTKGQPEGVSIDSQGNLYGTTSAVALGPAASSGIVFKLSPPSGGNGLWTETVLYTFPAGVYANGGLIFDAQGNLYGTSSYGGSGFGFVFELTPSSSDAATWTEQVLYPFSGGSDGAYPLGLIFDSSGNLYGTAGAGGDTNACVYQYPTGQSSRGCGVVFELSPNGRSWTERVLYSFTGGSDGGEPANGVIFDSSGNLYGTALGGGKGYGVAFELIPIS